MAFRLQTPPASMRGLACIAATLALPGTVFAQTATEPGLTWGFEVGAEYTDNVGRTSVDEESETIGIGAFTLGWVADRPRLDADVGAHLEYRKYMDDTYDDEVVGGVNGLVSYAFIPERFIWVVQDNFGQIATDPQAVDSPDNRESVNYFSTGPDITFDLTGRTALRLGARYSDAYYETSPEDNQSFMGSLALIRRLSDISSVSLNGSTNKIEYDEEELFGDYRLDQAFLRWEYATERTTFNIDGGYTVIDRDDEKSDGLLGRLELSRAVAARSRVGLNVGTEFATAGDAMRRDQTIGGIELDNDDAVAAGDPFQLDYAYLTWNTTWERSTLTAVLSARSEEHEVVTAADRDAYDFSVGISRQMSRRFDARLSAGYTQEEFVNTNFKFDEWTVGMGLRWLLGERFSLHLRVDHSEGSSEDNSRDYEENTAYLGLAYSRGGAR